MSQVRCTLTDCTFNAQGLCATTPIDITESGCETYTPDAQAAPATNAAPAAPAFVPNSYSTSTTNSSPFGPPPAEESPAFMRRPL
jgi:hypothetical protein